MRCFSLLRTIRVVAGFGRSQVEMVSLEILPRACDRARHLQVCRGDTQENYVAYLASPLGRTICNLRLKLQNSVTVCDIVREAT